MILIPVLIIIISLIILTIMIVSRINLNNKLKGIHSEITTNRVINHKHKYNK